MTTHQTAKAVLRGMERQPTRPLSYGLMYDPKRENRCPGCGHSNWWIGRLHAQCGFCSTAMVLPGAYVPRLEAA